MMQKHLIDKVAGGGRRFLAEKLPDNFGVFETPRGFTYMLSGALEVHLLALENKLKGREEELTEDIINATCTIKGSDGSFKEVSESPRSLSSPGHATVDRLLLRVLGVGGAAAEQRRRPQPALDKQQVCPNNSDLAGGGQGILGDCKRAVKARCEAGQRWAELCV